MTSLKRAVCMLCAAVTMAGAGVYIPAGQTVAAYAEDRCATADGFEYRIVKAGCELTGYSGSAKKIVIPPEIDGRAVVSVADKCFAGNDSCTEISVSGSVKKLGDRWAYGCDRLKKVTLKNGVRTIGNGSLAACPELSKVILPPSVESIDGELVDSKDIRKYSNFYFYRGTYAEKYLREHKYHRVTLPGQVRYYDVVPKKGALKVKWKPVATADGYQLQISPDRYRFKKDVKTVTVKGRDTKTYTFDGLTGDRRYCVRIRTYRIIAGKKYYGVYRGFMSVVVK